MNCLASTQQMYGWACAFARTLGFRPITMVLRCGDITRLRAVDVFSTSAELHTNTHQRDKYISVHGRLQFSLLRTDYFRIRHNSMRFGCECELTCIFSEDISIACVCLYRSDVTSIVLFRITKGYMETWNTLFSEWKNFIRFKIG